MLLCSIFGKVKTVLLLEVNGLSKGTKNFAHLYVPVFMNDRVSLNLGKPLPKGLWILDSLYIMPGLGL